MKDRPLISVCIPAYKNILYLKRLLDSLFSQSFTDYEVIITDDSPDDTVKQFVNTYAHILKIDYRKNEPALGTPENWNRAIETAKGEWIKLMHDDDWFAADDALSTFADAVMGCQDASFIFSAYNNVDLATHHNTSIRSSFLRRSLLKGNAATLLSKNIIGPPSVVIYKNGSGIAFDRRLKWLVDIDFYYRYLQVSQFYWINKPLVNIGLNEHQVTRYSSQVREVEIPEYGLFLEKAGTDNFSNLFFFDAWWRLIRNLEIRSLNDIRDAGYSRQIDRNVRSIIAFQRPFPSPLLSIGVISKCLMGICYLKNRIF